MKRHIAVIAWLMLTALAVTARSQDIHENAGTRAAAFLKMESGGRAAAMAGAYTGVADDVDGLFWNPAGVTTVENHELAGTQDFAFGGINHETLAYAQRLTETSVIGVSFQGVFARIERRISDTLDADSEFTAGTYDIGLTYGQTFGRLALGGSVRGIQERFDVEDHAGLSFDFGALYRHDTISVGASVLNLGPSIDDANLPLRVRIGASARLSKTGPRVAADVVIPNDDFVSLRFGIEQWFFDQVALRGGYYYTKSDNPSKGFSVGIGLKSQGTQTLEDVDFILDYAFVPEKGIGDSHRVSFLTRF